MGMQHYIGGSHWLPLFYLLITDQQIPILFKEFLIL
jgi:hypothetical protein